MDKKDIMNFVESVNLCSGVSTKNNSPYSFIEIKFVNGYECALFPGRGSDAMWIIQNVIVKD